MNFDDEQYYKILSKIYKIDFNNQMPNKEFRNIFYEVFKDSGNAMWNKLYNEALISDKKAGTYTYTTELGIIRYANLKRIKMYENVLSVVTWVTVAAAIISAVYAVLTYYGCGKTNNQPLQKLELKQEQPSTTQPLILERDTTKVKDTLLKVVDSGGK